MCQLQTCKVSGSIQAALILSLVTCSAQAANDFDMLVEVLPVLVGAGRHVTHEPCTKMLLLRSLHLPHVWKSTHGIHVCT